MWQAMYRCSVVATGCGPVARIREQHPITDTEPPPRCTDHDRPMVLVGWSQSSVPQVSRPVRWRKPGGFKAHQMELSHDHK